MVEVACWAGQRRGPGLNWPGLDIPRPASNFLRCVSVCQLRLGQGGVRPKLSRMCVLVACCVLLVTYVQVHQVEAGLRREAAQGLAQSLRHGKGPKASAIYEQLAEQVGADGICTVVPN